MKEESKVPDVMRFGQFEAHLGRNKKNELGSDGGVGGDKTWRWEFRRRWLAKAERWAKLRPEEDTL